MTLGTDTAPVTARDPDKNLDAACATVTAEITGVRTGSWVDARGAIG